MTTSSAEELSRIGEAQEWQLASARPDGTIRPYVTMWVVRAGDDLYVRSAVRPEQPVVPPREGQRCGSHPGRWSGAEGDVRRACPGRARRHRRRLHAKYDRYGPEFVGTVVGPEAAAVTIKLVPRATDS